MRPIHPLALPLLIALAAAGCTASRQATPRETLEAAIAEDAMGMDNGTRMHLADRFFVDGSVLQLEGRYADAITRFERSALFAPRLAAPRYAQARCYDALGRKDSALLRVRQALELDSMTLDVRLLAADLAVANGQIREAVGLYEGVLQQYPDNIQARFNAARLQHRTNPERAIEHYEYIRRNITSDYQTLLNLSDLYVTLGRYDEAIRTMHDLLLLTPGSTDVYTVLAHTYTMAGRTADAAAMLADVDRFVPSDSVRLDFLMNQARPIARGTTPIGEPGVRTYARALAEHLIASSPPAWQPWQMAGMLAYRAGDSVAADSLTARAMGNRTITRDGWLESASTWVNDGYFTRALHLMLPSASRFHAEPRVAYLIGYACYRTGSLDSAERYLRRSITLEEENAEAWSSLGATYTRQEKPAAAENAYQRATTLDPDNAAILNNYAYSLAHFNRKLDRAMKMISRALLLEPENETFLDTKGWIHYRLREYNEALRYIQRSVDIGGAGPDVYEHLGDTQLALGNRSEAREAYGRAVRLDPDNAELQRKYQAAR
ncbi:MAG TPA: tetratricopeptide repeat protein [Candidatus Kapabacteria bacterium]|nr:tetratricopeptide repeat protein [Candidatus Kapabacteria bacterium]